MAVCCFLKNFKVVENIYWRESKGNYIAEFAYEDRHVVAWFTKSGMLYCAN